MPSSDHAYYAVNSDTDTLLTDDEKTFQKDAPRPRRSRMTRFLAKIQPYLLILNLVGMIAIIGMLAGLYNDRREEHREEFQSTGDLTGFAPKFDQQITMFKPESRFLPDNPDDWFTDKVKEAWLEIVPRGLGYVVVKEPSKYSNLPNRLTNFLYTYENKTVFTTSMTHQLHCLHSMVHVYYHQISTPPKTPPSDMLWHLRHCFDYMRQSIMCSADMALEGEQTTFPDGVDGSDGWDARHVCKDYKQVKKHLEDNRVDDQRWI